MPNLISPRVVILGGGIGGVATALELRKLNSAIDIAVVDKEDCFTFTPAIYHTAAGELPENRVCVPLMALLGRRNIRFIHDEVLRIDWKTSAIETKNKLRLSYDFGVITLGAQTNFFNIAGMEERGFALKTKHDAEILEEHLDAVIGNGKKTVFLVCGGGLTGVEYATDLKDHLDKKCREKKMDPSLFSVELLHGGERLLPELPQAGAFAENELRSRGIVLHLKSRVAALEGQTVVTTDGKRFSGDIIVWTGGLKMLDVIEKSGLSLVSGEAGGRATAGSGIAVNEFLQVAGQPVLFAVGDCASPMDPATRALTVKTAWNAVRQARVAAYNIAALVEKKPLKPFMAKKHPVAFTLGHRTGALLLGDRMFTGYWVAQIKNAVEEWYVRSL